MRLPTCSCGLGRRSPGTGEAGGRDTRRGGVTHGPADHDRMRLADVRGSVSGVASAEVLACINGPSRSPLPVIPRSARAGPSVGPRHPCYRLLGDAVPISCRSAAWTDRRRGGRQPGMGREGFRTPVLGPWSARRFGADEGIEHGHRGWGVVVAEGQVEAGPCGRGPPAADAARLITRHQSQQWVSVSPATPGDS